MFLYIGAVIWFLLLGFLALNESVEFAIGEATPTVYTG